MPHENKKSETPCGISEQQTNGNGCCNPPFRTFFFHPDYTVGLGVSPNPASAKWRPLAGCTAGRESHPALKNPVIRLCKTVYRFAEIKYIPAARRMQAFFDRLRKRPSVAGAHKTVRSGGQGRRMPSHRAAPAFGKSIKEKRKICGSITIHSIQQADEIQSKARSNL